MLRATAVCDFSTSKLQKVVRTCPVLRSLTCKCDWRHSGARFFDSETSEIGPALRCFGHFQLQMCFAPQRRASFPHTKSKNCSALRCFLHFDLQMRFAPQRHAILCEWNKNLANWRIQIIPDQGNMCKTAPHKMHCSRDQKSLHYTWKTRC